jgi:hypothetical protein
LGRFGHLGAEAVLPIRAWRWNEQAVGRARSISIGTEHNMTRGFAEEGSPLGLA